MMVKPRPVSSAWMTCRTGATNKNKNSSGSVVPPTTQAMTPEISRPLILCRFSGRAQWYIASAAPGRPPRNAGSFYPATGNGWRFRRRSRGSSDSSAAPGRWSARRCDAVAADVEGAAGFGKADQRHQNMVQAKRQQQSLAGAKDHRPKNPPALLIIFPRALIPWRRLATPAAIASPTSPSTTVVTIGTKRVPPKKAEGRPAGRMLWKRSCQQPDDNSGDHRPEDPGID